MAKYVPRPPHLFPVLSPCSASSPSLPASSHATPYPITAPHADATCSQFHIRHPEGPIVEGDEALQGTRRRPGISPKEVLKVGESLRQRIDSQVYDDKETWLKDPVYRAPRPIRVHPDSPRQPFTGLQVVVLQEPAMANLERAAAGATNLVCDGVYAVIQEGRSHKGHYGDLDARRAFFLSSSSSAIWRGGMSMR